MYDLTDHEVIHEELLETKVGLLLAYLSQNAMLPGMQSDFFCPYLVLRPTRRAIHSDLANLL